MASLTDFYISKNAAVKGFFRSGKTVKRAIQNPAKMEKKAATGLGAAGKILSKAVERGGASRMGFLNKAKKIYGPAVGQAWGKLKPYQQIGAVAAPAYMLGRE